MVDIIQSLSMHPQLEKLALPNMNIGRNESTNLANVLHGMSELHLLNLFNNDVDDEGVDALVGALANSNLRVLNLSFNPHITSRGCQSLAALLENPNCNLERLLLHSNNIDNEGALLFANAMASNNKLKTLSLFGNGITPEGWSGFSKTLCDTSSINKTFLSNHTLEFLGVQSRCIPADVDSSMVLNRSSEDKNQVAIKKILKYHQHFDMQPFFEWDLKVLPHAVDWFDRARFVYDNNEAGIGNHKLGAIYQFIRACPRFLSRLQWQQDKKGSGVPN